MKQALMVLDIQNDYFSDQARMTVAKHQIEPTINGINDLIKRDKSRMFTNLKP